MQAQNVYDDAMTVKYMNKVIDGALKIQNDPELTSLDFLQTVYKTITDDDLGLNIVGFEQSFGFAITKLELENCHNIIPKLNNRHIKELIINNCNVSNIDLLQLDGLVELCFQCSQGCICNSKLIYNMSKFNVLTSLSLNGYNGVDINPLSQMTQLNILSLKSCGLIFVDSLRHLINLEELYLSHNQNIDITPLLYIPQITKLDLSSCGLKSIEVLKLLINLQDLSLKSNQIVFIQPLEELYQLQKLNAQDNKLIDLKKLKKHPNLQEYQLDFQVQPTEKEIQIANDNMIQRITVQQAQLIMNGELYIGTIDDNNFCCSQLLKIQQQLLQNLDVKQLSIVNCNNIFPKLNSNTMKELILIIYCLKSWNLDSLQFENLERFFLQRKCYEEQRDEEQYSYQDSDDSTTFFLDEDCCDNTSNQLEQSIIKFKKLKELCIEVEVNVNIALISQMTQLTILSLDCELSNIDAVKYLINLKQLYICSTTPNMQSIPIQHLTQLVILQLKCQKINVDGLKMLKNLKKLVLSGYINLDITPLQYIPQITKLDLSFCELKSIEVLEALVNLKDLSLQSNQIIYISPLKKLNQLQKLNAEFNTIIDLQTLQNHPNIEEYKLNDQEYPSEYEIRHANYLKKICIPTDSLKMLKLKKNPFTQAKQKVEDLLKKLLYQQVAFVGQVAVLFQQLNAFDNYQ
ncbi:Conserved_hypothetical protein [Hexamita inflata]|uniref:Uncharacterized protein n=1 Tax=Hexamita inflata TaxID=28002 RepID=A0AA86NBU4_9EUKA|nr:Conserved hypothetical protein [Hexamita inflata]